MLLNCDPIAELIRIGDDAKNLDTLERIEWERDEIKNVQTNNFSISFHFNKEKTNFLRGKMFQNDFQEIVF